MLWLRKPASNFDAPSRPKTGNWQTDRIIKIDSAKKCLATACANLEFPKFSHHDFRHFFATTCIESGVDIPTISRWLGHSDGGALAMKVYGHLQVEHSLAMGQRVKFHDHTSAVPKPAVAETKSPPSQINGDERRSIAQAKAKYGYPWWASENPLEVFLGQLQEETRIVQFDSDSKPQGSLILRARQGKMTITFMSLVELKQSVLALPEQERHEFVVWVNRMEADYGDLGGEAIDHLAAEIWDQDDRHAPPTHPTR